MDGWRLTIQRIAGGRIGVGQWLDEGWIMRMDIEDESWQWTEDIWMEDIRRMIKGWMLSMDGWMNGRWNGDR
jgi:hypothetical protein